MQETIPIPCPKCGQETLKTRVKLRADNYTDDLVCAGCGYKLTNLDIRDHMRKIALAQIGKALKKK